MVMMLFSCACMSRPLRHWERLSCVEIREKLSRISRGETKAARGRRLAGVKRQVEVGKLTKRKSRRVRCRAGPVQHAGVKAFLMQRISAHRAGDQADQAAEQSRKEFARQHD